MFFPSAEIFIWLARLSRHTNRKTGPEYDLVDEVSKNTPKDYEQARERRLLLHKKEINYLIGKATTKGLTILPLRVYTKGARIKLEIAVARRLKKHDRRERIKEREDKRKIERTLKEL